jgi:hypothetical protein
MFLTASVDQIKAMQQSSFCQCQLLADIYRVNAMLWKQILYEKGNCPYGVYIISAMFRIESYSNRCMKNAKTVKGKNAVQCSAFIIELDAANFRRLGTWQTIKCLARPSSQSRVCDFMCNAFYSRVFPSYAQCDITDVQRRARRSIERRV